MAISLKKDQSIALNDVETGLTTVALGLGWGTKKTGGLLSSLFGGSSEGPIDLDASCIVFDLQGKQIDVIWFRKLRSADGTIVHTGDDRVGGGKRVNETILVQLDKLKPTAHRLVFTVNSYTGEKFNKLARATAQLANHVTGEVLLEYDLTSFGPYTGLVMCDLTRSAAGWVFKALGIQAQGSTYLSLNSSL